MLLVISAFFNWIAINNSKKNNYSKCEAKMEGLQRLAKGELYCDYKWYYATVVLSLITAMSIVILNISIGCICLSSKHMEE